MSATGFFVTLADVVDLPGVHDIASLYAAERDYFASNDVETFVRRVTPFEPDAMEVCGACLVSRTSDEGGLNHIYGDMGPTVGGPSAADADSNPSDLVHHLKVLLCHAR